MHRTQIQDSKPTETPTPGYRTEHHTQCNKMHQLAGEFPDRSVDNSRRPTIPAADSVEEAWFGDVRRGLASLEDVIRAAEWRRDLRRLSVARLLGGAS